eukprot:1159113-Pelagomonas_calceolata.AAC.19
MELRAHRQTSRQKCALILTQEGMRSHTCTGRAGNAFGQVPHYNIYGSLGARARPEGMLSKN